MKIQDYRKELENQLQEISGLLKKSNRNIKKYQDLPNSHVYISNSNGCPQYYLKKEFESRKYIKKSDIKNISKFAQRDYEVSMNLKLKAFERKLRAFLDEYDLSFLDDYNSFSDAKKALIKPLIKTDAYFIEKWKEQYAGGRNPFPEEGIYQTNHGEMVRSKSEKIIADALEKYNVTYQYEPMLELGYNTIYPDFVALNIRTRKTIYWEHLGLVSDIEYAAKNFKKLQAYEKSGYVLGRDLIITMESEDAPIDVKLVEEKIREFLL
ncbi:MAG: hypothetical protein K6E79_09020 [Pseudobutyrivibrio sp.]|nr:hypothetical protein [Pseudobutyrivibrio sp.]